jgi:microcystin-dependent protein
MEGMIGEIRIFAGTFAPKNWAFCMGQVINIASNTALFSILGTTYGGNGTTNFKLPDLQGRAAIGNGAGPGLSQYVLGEVTGEPSHTLTIAELPSHTHAATAVGSAGGPNSTNPTGKYLGKGGRGAAMPNIYAAASVPPAVMSASGTQIGSTGGNQPHNNMQPYLAINYVICQYGIFPARN